ncbi:hypothetical protein Esti_002375 [Eimeria stiedai]
MLRALRQGSYTRPSASAATHEQHANAFALKPRASSLDPTRNPDLTACVGTTVRLRPSGARPSAHQQAQSHNSQELLLAWTPRSPGLGHLHVQAPPWTQTLARSDHEASGLSTLVTTLAHTIFVIMFYLTTRTSPKGTHQMRCKILGSAFGPRGAGPKVGTLRHGHSATFCKCLHHEVPCNFRF